MVARSGDFNCRASQEEILGELKSEEKLSGTFQVNFRSRDFCLRSCKLWTAPATGALPKDRSV